MDRTLAKCLPSIKDLEKRSIQSNERLSNELGQRTKSTNKKRLPGMGGEDPANEKKDTDANQADEATIVAFQACNPKISAVVCSLLIKYFLHFTKVALILK